MYAISLKNNKTTQSLYAICE